MSVVREIDNTDGFGGTEIHRIVFDIAIDELGAFHAVSVAGGQHHRQGKECRCHTIKNSSFHVFLYLCLHCRRLIEQSFIKEAAGQLTASQFITLRLPVFLLIREGWALRFRRVRGMV